MSKQQELNSFLPVYDSIPDSWEDAQQFLTEALRRISEAVNQRENGYYVGEELQTGRNFYQGTNNDFRTVFRKVIDLDQALPNSSNISKAHGITTSSNFALINLYMGSTYADGSKSFSTQYLSEGNTDSISLYLDATNINVYTTEDYSAYTKNFVVIEYIQSS